MIANDVNSLNDVRVLQRTPHTKLGSDLLLILSFTLPLPLWSKLLNSIDRPSILGRGFDKTDGASCTRSEYTSPLAVLFRQVCLGRF